MSVKFITCQESYNKELSSVLSVLVLSCMAWMHGLRPVGD